MRPKYKRLIDILLIPAIVALVGVASFGLGRLSALKEIERGVVIYPEPESDLGSSAPTQNANHD